MDLLGNQRGKLRSMKGRCHSAMLHTLGLTTKGEWSSRGCHPSWCRRSCSSQISFTRPMCQRRIPSARWHQPRKCCREHWKWQWLHSTKNWFLPLKDTESSYLKIAFQSSSRNSVELLFLNMPTDIQARWMGMVLYGPQELLNSLWPRQPLSKSSCRFLHVPWREIIRAKSPGQKISNFVRNIEKERTGLSKSCNHFKDLNIESFLLNHQDSGVAHLRKSVAKFEQLCWNLRLLQGIFALVCNVTPLLWRPLSRPVASICYVETSAGSLLSVNWMFDTHVHTRIQPVFIGANGIRGATFESWCEDVASSRQYKPPQMKQPYKRSMHHCSPSLILQSGCIEWCKSVLAFARFGNVMDWFAKCLAHDAQDGNDLISYDEMKASMLRGNAPFIPIRKWLTVSEFHRSLNLNAMHNLPETYWAHRTLLQNQGHVTSPDWSQKPQDVQASFWQLVRPCVVAGLPHCSARASSTGTCFCSCMAQMVLLWGKLRGLQLSIFWPRFGQCFAVRNGRGWSLGDVTAAFCLTWSSSVFFFWAWLGQDYFYDWRPGTSQLVKEMEAEILEARIQELAFKRGNQLMISEYKAGNWSARAKMLVSGTRSVGRRATTWLTLPNKVYWCLLVDVSLVAIAPTNLERTPWNIWTVARVDPRVILSPLMMGWDHVDSRCIKKIRSMCSMDFCGSNYFSMRPYICHAYQLSLQTSMEIGKKCSLW